MKLDKLVGTLRRYDNEPDVIGFVLSVKREAGQMPRLTLLILNPPELWSPVANNNPTEWWLPLNDSKHDGTTNEQRT